MFLTRGMLSNNAAATAGKGEHLLHLGRARKKGPFPNFPQRGTPLISGLLPASRPYDASPINLVVTGIFRVFFGPMRRESVKDERDR